MDMIARILLVVMLVTPVVFAQAAKKEPVEDEVEYLIPEDWETKKDEPKAPSTLELTPKTFQAGMAKHIKENPQCASAKWGKAHLMKEGRVVYQELKQNGVEIDIILEVSESGKVSNAKFTGPKDAKDDAQFRLMMCTTYAVMRALQPDVETPEQARRNMAHVWKSATRKPFSMAFYFNTIQTQFVPFEMSVL